MWQLALIVVLAVLLVICFLGKRNLQKDLDANKALVASKQEEITTLRNAKPVDTSSTIGLVYKSDDKDVLGILNTVKEIFRHEQKQLCADWMPKVKSGVKLTFDKWRAENLGQTVGYCPKLKEQLKTNVSALTAQLPADNSTLTRYNTERLLDYLTTMLDMICTTDGKLDLNKAETLSYKLLEAVCGKN